MRLCIQINILLYSFCINVNQKRIFLSTHEVCVVTNDEIEYYGSQVNFLYKQGLNVLD
jgi:hypothetical protein